MLNDQSTFDEVQKFLRAVVDKCSPVPEFAIPFTPAVMAEVLKALGSTNVFLVGSVDLYTTLLSRPEFAGLFDPVANKDMLFIGKMGGLMGIPAYSDCYYLPDDQVIPRGKVYFAAIEGNKIVKVLGFTLA
jgi:hypothetical protein